jgi:hypothetical protein
VILRMFLPSGSQRYISGLPSRVETNAISFPSGDQAGCMLNWGGVGMIRFGFLPSISMV